MQPDPVGRTFRRMDMPRLVRLMGQNHFTSDLHFGSGEDYLGRAITRFVREVVPAAAAAPVRRAG